MKKPHHLEAGSGTSARSVIDVGGLENTFGKYKALSNLDLQVERGEELEDRVEPQVPGVATRLFLAIGFAGFRRRDIA